MPELPEVEVIRRRITPLVVGRRICSLATTADSYFFVTKPASLRRRLPGRAIDALARVGKYLVASLDSGERLLLHLGMTGQLFASGATSPRLLSSTSRGALAPEQQLAFAPDEHTHLRLRFADRGPEVVFRDVRKFGKVQLLGPDEPCARLDRLGVDALAIDAPTLWSRTRTRQVAIKSLLLDQAVVAGLGNIYADEALFLARIRPTRQARRVRRAEHERLVCAIGRVLQRSIDTGGSSINDYVQPDGSDGGYQDERWVYGREGMPCRACGTLIRRVVVGQRSAHYCPHCQRRHKPG